MVVLNLNVVSFTVVIVISRCVCAPKAILFKREQGSSGI